MKHQITLKEIAKELGISVSTVSKSLKDYTEISTDTRQKVKAFAKLYNYTPNNIALSLKNRRSNVIGVVLPDVVHHFFSSVIKGIEDIAISRGYTIIISISDECLEKEANSIRKLSHGTVDGYILSLSEETLHHNDYSHLEEVNELELPIVMFDRINNNIDCDKVIIDDKSVAYNCVDHLIKNGHRKIGFLTTEDYLSVGKLRTDGYYQALTDNHITIDESLVLKIHTQSNYYTEIEKLVKSQTFDALVTVNEAFAATGIKVLHDYGIKTPEKVSVISLSDGIISRHMIPSITAVNQNGFLMGQKSATLLINRIEGKSDADFQTEIIPTNIIFRDSVLNKG